MKIKIIQIIVGSQAGTIHQGSTYIIPVVPPQENSDGHWISGPLRYFALPHGSCTDEAKDRHFAVFRHCPYKQQ